jgi:hypothetical protein
VNFEAGELAITVMARTDIAHAGSRKNIGRIVELLRFVGDHTFPGFLGPAKNVWVCHCHTPMIDGRGSEWSGEVLIAEKNLRPIRDTGGADEVLLIAQRKDDRKVPA